MGYLINIRITFKDPELVYSKAYGIIWDESATNYRGFEFFLLVEWKIHSYAIIPPRPTWGAKTPIKTVSLSCAYKHMNISIIEIPSFLSLSKITNF